MEPITHCQHCGKQISKFILSSQNQADSTEWVKSGFCSYACFEKDSALNPEQTNPKEEETALEKTKPWFAVIGTADSYDIYDNEQLDTNLKKCLIEGKYNDEVPVTAHKVDNDGKWEEADLSLSELVKAHFKLRILYEPILAYSLKGLKWGAIIGIGLKLLDTVILFAQVDPLPAVLLVGAVAIVFIPRIGWIGVGVAAFFMARISGVNVFMTVLASGLVGAILGCLPGMSIGGIIGFIKKKDIPLAQMAEPESANKMFLKVVLLPILGSALLIYL